MPLQPATADGTTTIGFPLVVPFAQVGIEAIPQVGGKNASLGEDLQQAITDGEAITASCCEGDEGRVYRGALPFRVEQGIDSISLNPDAVIATRLAVAAIEAELEIAPGSAAV